MIQAVENCWCACYLFQKRGRTKLSKPQFRYLVSANKNMGEKKSSLQLIKTRIVMDIWILDFYYGSCI